MNLSLEEQQRYHRHFVLPHVGIHGQKKLKAAKILCIGAGGLGSPALSYLNAAGIGTLGIVDDDHVELSNLQRQTLYTTHDIGTPKVIAAQNRLHAQNPHTQIEIYPHRLTQENALELIKPYDIVLDCTDNFNARYLINDACFELNKPNIYAGVMQFSGECSVFSPPLKTACYRCLYPTPPQYAVNCNDAGVLGVLPGMLGMLQTTEALKLSLNISLSLAGKILRVNGLTLAFDEFILTPDPDCLVCGQHTTFEDLAHPTRQFCTMNTNEFITPTTLHILQQKKSDFILLDVREPHEYNLCNLNGVLIPLGELRFRLNELDRNKSIIVHCKADTRSQYAVALLKEAGFPDVKYVKGGILAWAQEIEPNMKTCL